MRRLIAIFLILLALGAVGCVSDVVPEDSDLYPALDNCTVIEDDGPAVPDYNTGGNPYV
jgi:hypothetical protein